MQMKNTLIKISGFMLGVFCVSGVVFAATIWNISSVPKKEVSNSISSIEFNSVVNTLKNIYNDGTNVGINQPAPQETLDVTGDIIASEVLNKDGNYDGPDATLGCSTLGTDNNGNLECHSTYAWVYSAWSDCSKSCGGGKKTRTAECNRDDGEIVADKFCTTVPVLSKSCNISCCKKNCSRRVYDYTACNKGAGAYTCSSGCGSSHWKYGGNCSDWSVCKTENYKACSCSLSDDSRC